MNYHNQTYDQLNQPGLKNINMTQGQMMQANHYLMQNNIAGQQMGMNGMAMNNIAMNGQVPNGGMLGGFPGLGGLGLSMPQMPLDPRRFIFNGDQITYSSRFQQMSSGELSSISEIAINIRGQQVSTLNVLGLTCTIIWGSLLILPLFLLCMDCWKRCIYPNFELSQKFYSSLTRFSHPNLQSVVLIVTDNNFNRNKARMIYQFVSSQSSLIGFTFINLAQAYNYKQSQYSDFDQNMRPIKKLPLITDIRWYREIPSK